jgi:hypothetical protein
LQPICSPGGLVVDEALAIPKVQGLIVLLQEAEGWASQIGRTHSPLYRKLKADISQSLPLVLAIAREYDDDLADRINHGVNFGSGNMAAVNAANELLGILLSADEREAILAPKGPKLAAEQMHKWVWGAAAHLWGDGYHLQAVQSAASEIFDVRLPAKLSMPKGTSPEELVGKAFDDKAPLLTISGFAAGTKDWTNVYQGAKFLGLACIKLVRNLATHRGSASPTEDVLLEELAMLSRFARLVDESTV